ncbi:hypothetical protein [Psychrobacillus sp.]|uniref:hypothetical protein n=1 Tax=Psychrobacillus sp. TaxID=1871623 RepID=UPI0028BE9F60|nr:hypothetical protein [Psychrobacillus sp.]
MRIKFIFLIIISSLLIVGCSNNNEDNEVYEEIRATVWNFSDEQGWSYSKEDWESASIRKTIADDSYKTLDINYIGKEILIVSLEDRVASPLIFVDTDTNEVIGHMPGE